MDHKMVTVNQKRANKQQPKKTKKKGPLKVVYITNPIKFEASASEFRALVQELTGQDSGVPESFTFPTDDGGGEVAKAAAADVQDYVHTVSEGIKIGHIAREVGQNGLDPLRFGTFNDSYNYNYNDDDGFCAPQMMDSFQGLIASSFLSEGAHEFDDELKS